MNAEAWSPPTWTPPDPTPARIEAAVWRSVFLACVALGLVVTLTVRASVGGPQTRIDRTVETSEGS